MVTTLSLSCSSSDAPTRRTLSNLSLGVAKSKKVVVVTGAGISCSCGIPDFRSSDGLYNLVKQQYPDVVLKGRDLFDASLFRDPTSTAVFYTFISKLKKSIESVHPSPTHDFLKTLDTKGKLLRSYTQNIDGLEEQVGLLGSASEDAKSSGKGKSKIRLKDVKNVQLHGDIRRVRCTLCSANFPFTDEFTESFLLGEAPDCPECTTRSEARVARSSRALKVGKLRPAIVLYDEPHPLGDDIGSIETADLARKPDLLIIMGTSLKVHGLKKLVKDFAKVVHASAPSTSSSMSMASPKASSSKNAMKGKVIFVNKTPPSSEWNGIIDYHVEGDTDSWVERVVEDWKKMRPADWEVQTTLDGPEKENAPLFKASKENAVAKVPAKGKKGRRIAGKDANEESAFPSSLEQPFPSLDLKDTNIPQPPSSPSKRQRCASHYSKLECSPSKKRSCELEHDDIPREERGLLFGSNRVGNHAEGTSTIAIEIALNDVVKTKRRFERQASQSSLYGLEDEIEAATLVDPLMA